MSTAVITIINFLQNSPKVNILFGLLCKQICCQELSKIAQSGHTGRSHRRSVNSFLFTYADQRRGYLPLKTTGPEERPLEKFASRWMEWKIHLPSKKKIFERRNGESNLVDSFVGKSSAAKLFWPAVNKSSARHWNREHTLLRKVALFVWSSVWLDWILPSKKICRNTNFVDNTSYHKR